MPYLCTSKNGKKLTGEEIARLRSKNLTSNSIDDSPRCKKCTLNEDQSILKCKNCTSSEEEILMSKKFVSIMQKSGRIFGEDIKIKEENISPLTLGVANHEESAESSGEIVKIWGENLQFSY